MGMGKGAGNLIAELFLEHLNLFHDGNYDISPLLHVVDNEIGRIYGENFWGYSVEYYLSAVKHCTPSYARHFREKHVLTVEQIAELLQFIPEDKRISFDKSFADDLFHSCVDCEVDDRSVIQELKNKLSDTSVLVVAPGVSIDCEREKIYECIEATHPIIITINMDIEEFKSDYIFIANQKRYQQVISKNRNCSQLIITSNVRINKSDDAIIINSKQFFSKDAKIAMNSGMMALNMLSRLGVKEIILAGFDGFGYKKHANDSQPSEITVSEWDKMNNAITLHIKEISNVTPIKFLTTSLYQQAIYDNQTHRY